MVFNGSSVSPSAGTVIDEATHPVELAFQVRTPVCVCVSPYSVDLYMMYMYIYT